MSTNPIQHKFLNQEMSFLLFLGISCFLIFLFRIVYSGSLHYIFMPWNLFLGFLPLLFTRLIMHYKSIRDSRIMLVLMVGLWLLFFPNAPYMLTDLFHLSSRSTMPMWYDLFFVLSFAWTGLLAGFISLADIEKLMIQRRRIPASAIPYLSGTLLLIASFGIYLGRYLRWNSWDVFVNPIAVITDIADRFIHPFHHPRTWGMTLLMGFFLNIMYWSLRLIKGETKQH